MDFTTFVSTFLPTLPYIHMLHLCITNNVRLRLRNVVAAFFFFFFSFSSLSSFGYEFRSSIAWFSLSLDLIVHVLLAIYICVSFTFNFVHNFCVCCVFIYIRRFRALISSCSFSSIYVFDFDVRRMCFRRHILLFSQTNILNKRTLV